jgi:hypothetical protein
MTIYFTASDSRLPQPGGPGPVFISPRNRVAQLYSQALGHLFITSYNMKGYSGGILTHLHAEALRTEFILNII